MEKVKELDIVSSLCVNSPVSDAEVTTSKDVPGFVSNALLMPFLNEVDRTFSLIISVLKVITGYHVSREGMRTILILTNSLISCRA